MSAIEFVVGREVLDSRGNPTVEVEVVLDSGARGRAIAPAGASTGDGEAAELRDGGDRYGGKGVLGAVATSTARSPSLGGLDALDQREVDLAMVDLDGTPDKGRLGANAVVATSLAVAKAAAAELRDPPLPLVGRGQRPRAARAHVQRGQRRSARHQQRRLPGVHAHAGRRGLLRRGAALGSGDLPRVAAVLAGRGLSTGVGDEGGFAPDLAHNEDGVRLLVEAIEAAGRTPGTRSPSPSTRRPANCGRTAPTSSPVRAARSTPGDMVDYWVGLCERTRSSPSRTGWPRTTGTVGRR